MLVFKDNHFVPRDNFTYECPETGEIVISSNFPGMIYKAKTLRNKAKLPIPLNFAATLMHNWCVDHPEYCRDPDVKVRKPPPPSAPKLPYPKLHEQLKNFIADSAEWAKSGFKRSEKELVSERLHTCVDCEHWSGGSSFWNFRCRKCGCAMKIKVTRATAKCPAGKWKR